MQIINQSQLNNYIHYIQAKGFSPASRHNMIREYIQFNTWLTNQNLIIEELQYNDIMAYIQNLQAKNIKSITLQRYINGLKNVLNYWVDTQALEHNPIQQFNLKSI